MDKHRAWGLLCDEQADFVDLLRGLDDDQWSLESLCAGWDVRTVAVHAACGRKGLAEALRLCASVGFGSLHKVNAKELETHRDMPSDEIVVWLAAPIKEKGISDRMNQLRGLLIHQQDVRRHQLVLR